MDKKIMNNILSKSRMKIAACEFEKENIKKTNKNIPKLVATFVITTTVTGGLVYATGNAIYEKIWKQPEKYEFSYEVTEKDKENAISEEEARKKAEEYLRKIGLEDEISGLGLMKSWRGNDVIRIRLSLSHTSTIRFQLKKDSTVRTTSHGYRSGQDRSERARSRYQHSPQKKAFRKSLQTLKTPKRN